MTAMNRYFFCELGRNPGLPLGPVFAITSHAIVEMLDFFVSLPPESGGLLLGPHNRGGVEKFVPDEHGSACASTTVYSPDADLLNKRVEVLWKRGLEAKGIGHVHPGEGPSFPSSEIAYGKGDCGYVRKFFDFNEAAQHFFFPIFTIGENKITICSFVFRRGVDCGEPELSWAPFRITKPEEFGDWDYNPEWLATIEDESEEKDGGAMISKTENSDLLANEGIRRRLYLRQRGLVSQEIHNKCVVTIGNGAGSQLVLDLAKQGVANIVGVEFDSVEIHNVSRTAFSFSDGMLNRAKVDCMAEIIAAHNPFARYQGVLADYCALSRVERDALLGSCDLIVYLADSFESAVQANEDSLHYEVPAVFVGIQE